MKNYLLGSIIMLMLNPVVAQDRDAIVGKWQSEHGSGMIQIYRNQDKYYGKLIAIKDPHDSQGKPQLDINNPSAKLRSRPVIGIEILKDLEYKGKGVWDNGTIYNPKTGKSYSCKMSLLNNNKLDIKGYMGFSFIGKSVNWTRVH